MPSRCRAGRGLPPAGTSRCPDPRSRPGIVRERRRRTATLGLRPRLAAAAHGPRCARAAGRRRPAVPSATNISTLMVRIDSAAAAGRIGVEQPTVAPPERPVMAWGSDAVAELLRGLGLPFLSLNPGASYRGLHDSLVNHLGNERPEMVLALHEESAVAIAHGYAKVTE